jgi:hypothetical protein
VDDLPLAGFVHRPLVIFAARPGALTNRSVLEQR